MGFLMQVLNVFWFQKMVFATLKVIIKGKKHAAEGTRDDKLTQQGDKKMD